MSKRLAATILLILAVILLPYWVYIPALILAMGAFPLYWEAVIVGLLIDALYGGTIDSLYTLFSSAGFLVFVGLVILIPVRERLRDHV